MKRPLPWDEGVGGWRVGWQIPPVNRITHILQNITFPQTFLQTLKIDFFLGLNSSFESFMQKNSRHLLQNWLWEAVFLFFDNTITSFKFLKLADILRRSQGIYTPSKKNCHCFWCPRCHN